MKITIQTSGFHKNLTFYMKTSKQFHNVQLSVIKYSFYNYDKKGDIKISSE